MCKQFGDMKIFMNMLCKSSGKHKISSLNNIDLVFSMNIYYKRSLKYNINITIISALSVNPIKFNSMNENIFISSIYGR